MDHSLFIPPPPPPIIGGVGSGGRFSEITWLSGGTEGDHSSPTELKG